MTARITTPFGFSSSAAEVVAGTDLTGKRALVTGGASGIGIETVRSLAGAGAAVTIAVRDVDAGTRVAKDVAAATGGPTIDVVRLDLADLQTVQDVVSGWTGPLDILVNNAGVMAAPEAHTTTGWEQQFAINHLGHFALAVGLHPALAAAGSARIVAVSSTGHLLSPVVFDDVNFRFRPYDPWQAYGQSKTATILFAVEATTRWRKDGIVANALNPGAILTNLQRHVGGTLRTPEHLRKTIQQGAATSVLLAVSPLLAGVGGRYFNDCNEAVPVERRPQDVAQMGSAVAPYALDPTNASRLWKLSTEAVRLAKQNG